MSNLDSDTAQTKAPDGHEPPFWIDSCSPSSLTPRLHEAQDSVIFSDLSNPYPEVPAARMARGLVAVICLMSFNGIHAGSIYKTYDDQGNVVFTDQPVDEDSAELLETPSVNVSDPLPVAPQSLPQLPATVTPAADGITPRASNTNVAVPKPGAPVAIQAAPQATIEAAPQAGASPGAALSATPATATQQTTAAQPVDAAAIAVVPVVSAGEQPRADSVPATAVVPEHARKVSPGERVATPVLPAGARPPVIGAVKPATKTQVSINWPTPDEIVLSTQSPIWIELDSQPSSLKALGLLAEVWIDDKLSVSGERPLLPLVLPEIGMHKLQVRLVDSEGNSVAESDSQLMDIRLGAPPIR